MSAEQPTAGAMRAAKLIWASMFSSAIQPTENWLAEIIDRETGVAELVAALERVSDELHSELTAKFSGYKNRDAIVETHPDIVLARAALAKHAKAKATP